MKLDKSIKDVGNNFVPFTVPLRVESLEDAKRLYALFTHVDVLNFLNVLASDSEQLRSYIYNNCKQFCSDSEYKFYEQHFEALMITRYDK